MKKLNLLVLAIILLALFNSCQEIYDAPSIKTDQSIMTVKGMITNDSGPYYVRLSKALPFNYPETATLSDDIAVRDATVIIRDNTGNSELLQEKSPGLYMTSSTGIRGVAGRSYTLSVVTKKGDTYTSGPCLLNPALLLDTIYYEEATHQYLISYPDGSFGINTVSGVNIYADMTSLDNQAAYYKIDTRIIREIYNNEYPDGIHKPAVHAYCWTVYHLDEVPNLNANVTHEQNKIKKQLLGFLAKDKMSDNPASYEDFSLVGRIISCYTYTLSEEADMYYMHLREQLTAENKLFDPVSTNLISNIKCENDASKKVFGLFEASGKVVRHSLLKYNVGDIAIQCKNIDYVPENVTSGNLRDHTPYDSIPNFWHDF
jgi:hypothetical protein